MINVKVNLKEFSMYYTFCTCYNIVIIYYNNTYFLRISNTWLD